MPPAAFWGCYPLVYMLVATSKIYINSYNSILQFSPYPQNKILDNHINFMSQVLVVPLLVTQYKEQQKKTGLYPEQN